MLKNKLMTAVSAAAAVLAMVAPSVAFATDGDDVQNNYQGHRCSRRSTRWLYSYRMSYPSAKAFAKAWTSSMAGTWNYIIDWTTEGQNVSKTKADGDTDITHQAGTYLVTVPTKITFTGKYIHLATKSTSTTLSSNAINLSFNQGKTVWSKENAYGTVNPDGSNTGTNSTNSVSLTGEVKSVGKYTGLITYESSMTNSDK